MRHEDVRNYLSDYIEGTLDSALAAAIENHLRDCDACAREETSLRAVFHALDDPALNVTPPPMFHADAMRRVRLQAGSKADRRGFLERLGWPKALAAGAAALAVLAAVVLSVGPLGNGITAGYTPAIQTSAPQRTLSIELAGPVRAGQEVRLRLSGKADSRVETSSGFARGPEASGWDGPDLRLTLLSNTVGTVQEAAIRPHNAAADATVMVFIPVETGGAATAAHDWRAHPAGTLRTALETAARAYGVPITAPNAALNTPVSLGLQDAEADAAIPAIARAAGLTATQRNGTWQVGR